MERMSCSYELLGLLEHIVCTADLKSAMEHNGYAASGVTWRFKANYQSEQCFREEIESWQKVEANERTLTNSHALEGTECGTRVAIRLLLWCIAHFMLKQRAS